MKKAKLGLLALVLSLLLSACGFLDGITGASKSDDEGKEATESSESTESKENSDKPDN